MLDARRWGVADGGLIPPQIPEWGWIVAFAGSLAGFAKLLSEWSTGRATRAKLDAERQAADALREKSLAERDLAETLGGRAHQELQEAGMPGVAALITQALLKIDDLRAQLEDERDQGRRFRGAVLEFLSVLEAVVPELPTPQRRRIQDALTTLRHHDGWER